MPSTDLLVTALLIITPNVTINLNDHVNYAVSGNTTRQAVQTTYTQTMANSPVLAGSYLTHSVPGMVTEQVQIWAYGSTQAITQGNYNALRTAFESWQYQLQWTWADYTETWNCNQVTQISSDMSQGMVHNYMSCITLTVPRFPTILIP
jgi:hypothetical protein